MALHDEILGKEYETLTGKFKVIKSEKLYNESQKRNRTMCYVEFDEINGVVYGRWIEPKEVFTLTVKNPYYPVNSGFGYMGEMLNLKNIKHKEKVRKIWSEMISRCYNENNVSYKTYGAIGVKVCDRWANFSNFYEDYFNLEGFDEQNIHNLILDKDIRCNELNIYPHFYSKETCILTSKSKNSAEVNKRTKGHKFIVLIDDISMVFESKLDMQKYFNFKKYHNIEKQIVNLGYKIRKLTPEEITLHLQGKPIKF